MKKDPITDSDFPWKIVCTGGGTGGHVYPGIAVAKELKHLYPRSSILFIGTEKGLETKIVPHEGFTVKTVRMHGFKNKGIVSRLRSLWLLPGAVWRAKSYLKAFQAQVVFGTGGYVSVPVLYAAYLLHLPTLTLEPNRQAGLANRLLAKSVDRIAVCFQESALDFPEKKVVVTGNPIRKEFYLIGKTPPPDRGNTWNLLVLGGSLGSQSINAAMIDALGELKALRDQVVISHQSGEADYQIVKRAYEEQGFHADVCAYISDVPKVYAKSHLVICRAGASTVAELQASRRPAILIPYPHGDRHQERNAQALVDKGLSKMILQEHLSGQSLAEAIQDYIKQPEEFAQVWSNHNETHSLTASEKLVDLCLELAVKHIHRVAPDM
ncbi:undecaprenyldiphospho-muramoylpentapeptide beta-N-acetylglucosaminyltransferase [candidate division KSB3 bacterium]|uniref:UDP-N-acetylglucosamine--N-acetylmuramyl-(pentapeptide) pyrophosphoryl-undecaprenol N-acetylglucosamine transferase n=1 Tax=candidate division KSB3 bacterium TaxID=2044937 RepID=A0A2G6E480_9BACT|nr:MAG: undecaprenyldiphospho-muramoylpentapeptide beta-N-acetylglucosaminyltransferase [candidate division KSB3 bacterium]PIE29448.1 MAG: undecaprenyldiphospho-muramoylpentapeptide beta-N-acetylglucosaminyltransferase [candidate division KSB3 bacterium]